MKNLYEVIPSDDARLKEYEDAVGIVLHSATEDGGKRSDGYLPDVLLTFVGDELVGVRSVYFYPEVRALHKLVADAPLGVASGGISDWLLYLARNNFEAYSEKRMDKLMG